ncbi:LolA-like protein [Edaphobacter flagellatus]|uniref:hypothetical protein n=1 Tax=Edaphobacter flagellatus TaxID=1933044 RepID=UPI0021B44B69|nr:hypothetical protein [Edaphobacter flagellatus]
MPICFGKPHPKWVGLKSFHFALPSVFLLLIGATPVAIAQSASPSTSKPVPIATNKLGQFDTAALSEVLEHLKVVGAAPWTGMQGTGTIAYANETASYPATLTIQGSSKFRLDGQAAKGTLSIRIDGRVGKVQEADGRTFPLAPETASSGIVQFQMLRLADLQTASSLTDHGVVSFDQSSLHRTTIERYFSPASKFRPLTTVATDLYFDPQTHLLAKSANSIQIDGAGNNRLLRVITYEDYRLINGMMVPFRFIQTLDGQKQWTLQLSEVQLGSNQPATFFQF